MTLAAAFQKNRIKSFDKPYCAALGCPLLNRIKIFDASVSLLTIHHFVLNIPGKYNAELIHNFDVVEKSDYYTGFYALLKKTVKYPSRLLSGRGKGYNIAKFQLGVD